MRENVVTKNVPKKNVLRENVLKEKVTPFAGTLKNRIPGKSYPVVCKPRGKFVTISGKSLLGKGVKVFRTGVPKKNVSAELAKKFCGKELLRKKSVPIRRKSFAGKSY